MLCPTHGAVIIGPPCMRCVGEDGAREIAEFAGHVRRLRVDTLGGSETADPGVSQPHDPECRTRTVLGMLLKDRIRPEPHMELRGLETPVKALAVHHLVQGFAERDHARFVELTGSADDSGAEPPAIAHPTEER